jgi:hypothetical protein
MEVSINNHRPIRNRKLERILRHWNPLTASIVQGLTILALVAIFIGFEVYSTDYFHFGPRPDLVLFGIVLDTWPKLLCGLTFAFVLQTIVSTTSGIIGVWQTTDLYNTYVSTSRYNIRASMFIMTVHYYFGVLDWFISFKMDFNNVQFLIATTIPDFANAIYMTLHIKREKEIYALYGEV